MPERIGFTSIADINEDILYFQKPYLASVIQKNFSRYIHCNPVKIDKSFISVCDMRIMG